MAFLCIGVRLGVVFRGCDVSISLLTLFRYVSISDEAVGGSQDAGLWEDCF